MSSGTATLPIDALLPEILDHLRTTPSLVVEAPPGAGKTTRIPPALLDPTLVPADKLVVVLEPRRVAARAAARRMSQERGEPVGRTVGYHIRFDRVASSDTRLLVVTEGLLLRMIQDDPFLERVGAVILDEFHERGLDADLALALCHRVQQEVRPDLRIIVMSATLDAEPVARFLGHCHRVRSEGRSHPVDITYLPGGPGVPLEGQVLRAARTALEDADGDILVFLPGVGEIQRCQRALTELARAREADVLPLYGDLPTEAQDRAIQPGPRRRIVLATNVAETSVTIAGVRTVIDSGLQRRSSWDASVGFDRLVSCRISKASAVQRAGRAGRTAPGRCIRLWSHGENASMDDFEPAEIHRVDLAGPVLQLLCWGEADVHGFPFFDAPASDRLDDALERLRVLGALDPTGVTPIGRAMARIPAAPRLARLLVEGRRLGVGPLAARAAALLSERDLFVREDDRPTHPSNSDLIDRLEALEARTGQHAGRTVRPGAARKVQRVAEQLERSARSLEALLASDSSSPEGPKTTEPPLDRLGRALVVAWPDRVTLARPGAGRRGVMVGRRGVQLSDRSALAPEENLWLSLEIAAGRRGLHSDALVHVAAGIDPAWLPHREWRTEVNLAFDPDREQVMASRRRTWRDLVFEEQPMPLEDPLETAAVLAAAARANPERALDLQRAGVAALRARVHHARAHFPEADFPDLSDTGLLERVEPLCWGLRSFAELRALPPETLAAAWLTPAQRALLEREAPTHLTVPSGRRVPLAWSSESAPVLAARIQELFGWSTTPAVLGSRVPVVVHLLAPNGRPQQVTTDLRSFWENTYPEVRRELRARYAKHAWPDDPWNAQATSRTRRRTDSG